MTYHIRTRSKKFFSEKQKGFRDGLPHSTPQKSKETRGNAITQSRSHPIKKKTVEFRENILLLVCELFRAHEMRSQLEVTEMLECKVNLTV